jgi:hypothetical protein
MPFVKGQSGNPTGRPKVLLPDGRSLQDVAREYTISAVETLVGVMTNEEAPHAAQVSAASAILDRGWGKPRQEVDAGENMVNLLADIIAGRRAKVADMNKDG